MKLREQKGFTLIEVIVVAGIIAVLAGILVPLIFKEIDESKISRAAADVRSISSALFVMRKDTGQWPVSTSCIPDVTMINSQGTMPTFIDPAWNSGNSVRFENYLNSDSNGCWGAMWKGPYLSYVGRDPWGGMYVVNADAFLTTNPVWIISAGPDGIVQTAATANQTANDDIGIRLK